MAAEKRSSFSVTCSLLSRYVKEKRSCGELGMIDIHEGSTSSGISRPPTTLNLLPGINVSAENQTDTEDVPSVSSPETVLPLTIFYDRKMMVFENLSADEVSDLMKLAYKGSSVTTPSTLPSKFEDVQIPIARRASLHRFLQKRKDRIVAKAPYQVNILSKKETETTIEDAGSWLALGLKPSAN